MEPDIDAAAAMIRETEPALALFGASVFLFPTPLQEQRRSPTRHTRSERA